MAPFSYTIILSPFGTLSLVWRDTEKAPEVLRLFLPDGETPAESLVRMIYPDACPSERYAVKILSEKIRSYLEGEVISFDLDNLALEDCSEFRGKVLQAVCKIPRGR